MLIYTAGPYREFFDPEGNRHDTPENIEVARKWAIKLWEAGHVALCPHLNTAQFENDCVLSPTAYIEGDLKMLAGCDAIFMLPNWELSAGAEIEKEFADLWDIPVFFWHDGVPALHVTEVRCPIQADMFRNVLGRIYRTHLKKNADYSPANIKGTGLIGCAVRLWDKVCRILNLLGFRIVIEKSEFVGARPAANEPLEDAFLDTSTYGVIGYLEYLGYWGK